MLLISFFIIVCCRATSSVKLNCKIESNLENSPSRFCKWQNLDLHLLQLNKIVFLLIKPLIASQRILGSSTEPTLRLRNFLSPETNCWIYSSFFSNVVLKRHLAAHLETNSRVIGQKTPLWSERLIGRVDYPPNVHQSHTISPGFRSVCGHRLASRGDCAWSIKNWVPHCIDICSYNERVIRQF